MTQNSDQIFKPKLPKKDAVKKFREDQTGRPTLLSLCSATEDGLSQSGVKKCRTKNYNQYVEWLRESRI